MLGGALGAAASREERVRLLAERFGLADGLSIEELEDPARYLLVEESRHDGGLWLSDAASAAEAAAIHDRNECAEDFEVVGLVDLDTGEVAAPVAMVTSFVEDPVAAAVEARRVLPRLQALFSKEVWQIRGSGAEFIEAVAAELASAGYDPEAYVPAADESRWGGADGEEWIEGIAAARRRAQARRPQMVEMSGMSMTGVGEPASFGIDEARLAELFAEKAEENDGPASLEQFSGESASAQLASLVYDAAAAGALVLPVVGGERIEVAIYANDDEYGMGLILAIRPKGFPSWWGAGLQVATTYEELDDYLGRDEQGMFDLGERAMREALDYVVVRANSLLGFLVRVASAAAGDAAA